MADYGEAQNLLECVPTYINKVPSFNAADVWMMRELADILEEVGEHGRGPPIARRSGCHGKSGDEPLCAGNGRLGEPASRRQPGWRCATVMTSRRWAASSLRDLPANVAPGDGRLCKRELLTEKWMRAQSMLDVAAADSDRPDHGPMGAYDAWPAVTVDAMCRIGLLGRAISFLRRTQAAFYEGVYAQAHEFYGPKRRDPTHQSALRSVEGCMRECTGGGAFTETVVCTLFGYLTKLGGAPSLLNPGTARGFNGELRHVCRGSQKFTIQSGNTGLNLREEV